MKSKINQKIQNKKFAAYVKKAFNFQEAIAKAGESIKGLADNESVKKISEWAKKNPELAASILGGVTGTTLGGLADSGNRWRGAILGGAAGAGIGALTPKSIEKIKKILKERAAREKAKNDAKALEEELRFIENQGVHSNEYDDLKKTAGFKDYVEKLKAALIAAGDKTKSGLKSVANKIEKDPALRIAALTGTGLGSGGLLGALIAGKGKRWRGATTGAALGSIAGLGASAAIGADKEIYARRGEQYWRDSTDMLSDAQRKLIKKLVALESENSSLRDQLNAIDKAIPIENL